MKLTLGELFMRLVYLTWVNVPPLRPLCDRLMRRVFSTLAPRWDERTGARGQDRTAPLVAALDLLESRPERILDLGCGTGAGALMLAERFPHAWVTGIDASLPMIAEATRKSSERGSSARFEVGELQRTGLPTACVDLVVLLNAPPSFDEIGRLLRPGGHVVVAHSRGDTTPFYSSPARLERGFARHDVKTVGHGKAGAGEYFFAVKR